MENKSWASNQTKAEDFPAGGGQGDVETPGADDLAVPGAEHAVALGDEAPGTSEQLPVVQGLHVPDVEEPDTRG